MTALSIVLGLAAFLIIIGLYCVSTKRNMIKIVIGIEMMMNGVTIAFVYFATFKNEFISVLPLTVSIMLIGLGGCTGAIGLSIILALYKHYETLDLRELRRLKW